MTFAKSMLWLLWPLAALPAQQEPVPDAAALQKQFDEAQREWSRLNTEAYEKHDEAAQQRLRQNRPETLFAPRFAAGARAAAGTEQAVPFLSWLVSRADSATSKQALATLMESHIESPGIRLAVARIGGLKDSYGAGQSRDWLDRVLARNQDAGVRAQALFTRAGMYVGTRSVEKSDALRRYAIADLEASRALLQPIDDRDARCLLGLVDALLDEARWLEPGLVAPEIEGQDLDGVAFKLSDYRGKVVLLDFWGDW